MSGNERNECSGSGMNVATVCEGKQSGIIGCFHDLLSLPRNETAQSSRKCFRM